MDESESSFLGRHQFLIYRLFSLCGLVPVGAYMVVHLLTNALVVQSAASYQKAVYSIHGIPLLPVVEWTFIFIPIIFHAIIGTIIIAGGLPNATRYTYGANIRYTLQRATGMIAALFIFWHVFHMHGWIHADWWVDVVRGFPEPFSGANFRPFNAASSAAAAMQNVAVISMYALGVLSCVYHFANGVWTAGITWGIWTTPNAQSWASKVCATLGVLLLLVGLASVWGMHNVDQEKARQAEDAMYHTKTDVTQEIEKQPHKRLESDEKHGPSS